MEEDIKIKMEKLISSKSISVAEMKTLIQKAKKYKIERQKAENEKRIGAVIAMLCPNPEDLIKLLAIFKELYPDDIEGINDIKIQLEKAYQKKALFMGVYLFLIAESLEALYRRAYKNYVRVMAKDDKAKQKLILKQKQGKYITEQENINAFIQADRRGKNDKWFKEKDEKEFEYEQRIGQIEQTLEEKKREENIFENTKKSQKNNKYFDIEQAGASPQDNITRKTNKKVASLSDTLAGVSDIDALQKNDKEEIKAIQEKTQNAEELTIKTPKNVQNIENLPKQTQKIPEIQENIETLPKQQQKTPEKLVEQISAGYNKEPSNVKPQVVSENASFGDFSSTKIENNSKQMFVGANANHQPTETINLNNAQPPLNFEQTASNEELLAEPIIKLGIYKADEFLEEFNSNIKENYEEVRREYAIPEAVSLNVSQIMEDVSEPDIELEEEFVIETPIKTSAVSLDKLEEAMLNQLNFDTQ